MKTAQARLDRLTQANKECDAQVGCDTKDWVKLHSAVQRITRRQLLGAVDIIKEAARLLDKQAAGLSEVHAHSGADGVDVGGDSIL